MEWPASLTKKGIKRDTQDSDLHSSAVKQHGIKGICLWHRWPGEGAELDISWPEALGMGSLCSRFSTTTVCRYTLWCQTSPKSLCSHPFLQAPCPDGNLGTRQGKLPETHGNPAGTLLAGVDADTEPQGMRQLGHTHFVRLLSSFMDNFKIQLKKLLHFWVTISSKV